MDAYTAVMEFYLSLCPFELQNITLRRLQFLELNLKALKMVIELLFDKRLEHKAGSHRYTQQAYHRTFALLRSRFELLNETLNLVF